MIERSAESAGEYIRTLVESQQHVFTNNHYYSKSQIKLGMLVLDTFSKSAMSFNSFYLCDITVI